jgi:hypothetical protein
LAERRVVSLLERTEAEVRSAPDEPLAAVPLLAASGAVCGVVAIRRMAFEAFHAEGLRCVEVLASGLMAEVDPDTWRMWMSTRGRANEGEQGDKEQLAAGARAWDAIA